MFAHSKLSQPIVHFLLRSLMRLQMLPPSAGTVKISSVMDPTKVLGVSGLACNKDETTSVVLLDAAIGIEDSRKLWKVSRSGGGIKSLHCEDYFLDILGDSSMAAADSGKTIVLSKKNDLWSQRWDIPSTDLVLREAGDRSAEQWTPKFTDPGYDLALHPGFPGEVQTIANSSCLSSTKDRELAKSSMRQCDESMSFLVGSQASVGRIKGECEQSDHAGNGKDLSN